jgi:hypothetical protein
VLLRPNVESTEGHSTARHSTAPHSCALCCGCGAGPPPAGAAMWPWALACPPPAGTSYRQGAPRVGRRCGAASCGPIQFQQAVLAEAAASTAACSLTSRYEYELEV